MTDPHQYEHRLYRAAEAVASMPRLRPWLLWLLPKSWRKAIRELTTVVCAARWPLEGEPPLPEWTARYNRRGPCGWLP